MQYVRGERKGASERANEWAGRGLVDGGESDIPESGGGGGSRGKPKSETEASSARSRRRETETERGSVRGSRGARALSARSHNQKPRDKRARFGFLASPSSGACADACKTLCRINNRRTSDSRLRRTDIASRAREIARTPRPLPRAGPRASARGGRRDCRTFMLKTNCKL